MIPQRIERRSHPYQKCALPIKLRNLNKKIKFNYNKIFFFYSCNYILYL